MSRDRKGDSVSVGLSYRIDPIIKIYLARKYGTVSKGVDDAIARLLKRLKAKGELEEIKKFLGR